MAKVTGERLIELLRKSGLLETERLDRALAEYAARKGAAPEADPDAFTEFLVQEGLLTAWQAKHCLAGRSRGFFLGKYKLLDQIGAGGMSTVYLAEHVNIRRRAAIKVLPEKRVNDTSYLGRFEREARAAGALDHPNVVRVYDFDNQGNTYFLVMEYVEGQDLMQIVRKEGPLPYETAAAHIRQAALGLAHAHENGLIHRDVKPANVLVDGKGVVKLLDMGLARFSDDEQASLTVQFEENVLGTADYLAPEQARNSHDVDLRADIYGLGCTLYYALTGHPPFPDGTLPQRLMKHLTQEPPSISLDRPDCPSDLQAICAKMMAKQPGDRYQTCKEVADVLGDWLAQRGGSRTVRPRPAAAAAQGRARPSGGGTALKGDSDVSFPAVDPRTGDSDPMLRGGTTPRPGSSPFVDTSSDLGRKPGSGPRLPGDSGSQSPAPRKPGDSDVPKGRRLPVAKPLDGDKPLIRTTPAAKPGGPAAAKPETPAAAAAAKALPRKTSLSWFAVTLWTVVVVGLVAALVVVLKSQF